MNTPHRDPVCGMVVDPSTAEYSSVHEGTTWYFCADHCRQQFIAHPEQYLGKQDSNAKAVLHHTMSWPREALVWFLAFVAVVFVVSAARGFSKKAVSVTPGTTIIGAAAGPHQAVDGGQGGVISEATHEQETGTLEFTVSLNTHTVDLTTIDPFKQIFLTAAGQEYAPLQSTVAAGEQSSHHMSYRLRYAQVKEKNVTIVVRDVGGIAQRELPFSI